MAATLSSLPPDQDGWGFEIKWDGIRAIAYVEDDRRVRLTSRTLRDITGTYPEIQAVGAALAGHRAVLDGEIVAFDDNGRPSFQRLQARMNVTGPAVIEQLRGATPVTYVVFDLLYLDGRSMLGLPYDQRRAQLDTLLHSDRAWQVPAYVRGQGSELLEASRAQHLEGIIAKRLSSRYRPGRRSRDWLKVKNIRRQEFVIGGWLPGEGGLTGDLGALAVGYYDEGGALRYAGRVGTGFNLAERRRLQALLQPLEVAHSPFVGAQPDKRGCVFVEPRLVCEVAYAEWTDAGTLRQPSYKGTRDDKPARDVVREVPTPPSV